MTSHAGIPNSKQAPIICKFHDCNAYSIAVLNSVIFYMYHAIKNKQYKCFVCPACDVTSWVRERQQSGAAVPRAQGATAYIMCHNFNMAWSKYIDMI